MENIEKWHIACNVALCNFCVCERVCKYKEVYQNGIEATLNVGFWKVQDCPLAKAVMSDD